MSEDGREAPSQQDPDEAPAEVAAEFSSEAPAVVPAGTEVPEGGAPAEPPAAAIGETGEDDEEIDAEEPNQFANPDPDRWIGGYPGLVRPWDEYRFWAVGVIVVVGMVIFAFVGITHLLSPDRASESAATSSATASTVPAGSPYTDAKDGFSVEVPAGWTGETSGSHGIELTNPDLDARIRVSRLNVGLPLCSVHGAHPSVASCARTYRTNQVTDGGEITVEEVHDTWFLMCGKDPRGIGFCTANRIGEKAEVGIDAEFPVAEEASVEPVVKELMTSLKPGDLDSDV